MTIPREAELLSAARRAFDNAYAPYSKFQVGAALLGESGAIYWGCNVENATYGATVCAERNALADAARHGERRVVACLVVTDHHRATPPCGICRQVLREFARDLPIVSHTIAGLRDTWTLQELLPVSFGPEDLLPPTPPEGSEVPSEGSEVPSEGSEVPSEGKDGGRRREGDGKGENGRNLTFDD